MAETNSTNNNDTCNKFFAKLTRDQEHGGKDTFCVAKNCASTLYRVMWTLINYGMLANAFWTSW